MGTRLHGIKRREFTANCDFLQMRTRGTDKPGLGSTMPPFKDRSKKRSRCESFCAGVMWLCVPIFAIFLTACNELQKPAATPFFSETQPPPKQEFRWSNGKPPKSFDPAKAAAPPETDFVRAIYEGLTEIAPVTWRERPAVAERWTSSEDRRNWTFYLRDNARWSNGKPVTAFDFVRSWKRL